MNTSLRKLLSIVTILSIASAALAANQAPKVAVGSDQQVKFGSAAFLHGRVTDDGLPRGQSLRIKWYLKSAPGTVQFANVRNTTTTATFSSPGTYVLELHGYDGQLLSVGALRVKVTSPAPVPVPNTPPRVDAGTDQEGPYVGSGMLVYLAGTATDFDGPRPLTFVWHQTDGPAGAQFLAPTRLATAVRLTQPGIYRFALDTFDGVTRVTDDLVVRVDIREASPISYIRSDAFDRGAFPGISGHLLEGRLYNDHPNRVIVVNVHARAKFNSLIPVAEFDLTLPIAPRQYAPANFTSTPAWLYSSTEGFLQFTRIDAAFR